jgi:hypothetical protein
MFPLRQRMAVIDDRRDKKRVVVLRVTTDTTYSSSLADSAENLDWMCNLSVPPDP